MWSLETDRGTRETRCLQEREAKEGRGEMRGIKRRQSYGCEGREYLIAPNRAGQCREESCAVCVSLGVAEKLGVGIFSGFGENGGE